MSRHPETAAFWRGRLPHWEVAGGRYFVTIHLAGAIPPAGEDRIRELAAACDHLAAGRGADGWLRLQRRAYVEMEAWLDRAGLADHLRREDVAEIVTDAISFRQGRAWNVFEYVVMPSHLHLFFELLRPGLKECVEQFKRWTGHRAAGLSGLGGTRFWQDEWFDHWSRSGDEDDRIIQYIRHNPVKAGLVTRYEDWPYGSWSARQSAPAALK